MTMVFFTLTLTVYWIEQVVRSWWTLWLRAVPALIRPFRSFSKNRKTLTWWRAERPHCRVVLLTPFNYISNVMANQCQEHATTRRTNSSTQWLAFANLRSKSTSAAMTLKSILDWTVMVASALLGLRSDRSSHAGPKSSLHVSTFLNNRLKSSFGIVCLSVVVAWGVAHWRSRRRRQFFFLSWLLFSSWRDWGGRGRRTVSDEQPANANH